MKHLPLLTPQGDKFRTSRQAAQLSLNVCARPTGHQEQHALLHKYCPLVTDWQQLLQRAEEEGMAPLLKKHLEEAGCSYPLEIRRSLHLLTKRHQHFAALRTSIVEEILALLAGHGLTPILLKGIALAYSLYPEPGLRPMRDIDLLLPPKEASEAQRLLKDFGFVEATSPIPEDHFHLPSLFKKIGDLELCLEVHRGLYPNCPPYYPAIDINTLRKNGRSITIGNSKAITLGNEAMLHYLYQHAFRPPLTYESYKLINAADIIAFTEANYNDINWQLLQKDAPLLCKALPLLHHISPYNMEILPDDFRNKLRNYEDMRPAPYHGWPHKKRKEWKREKGYLIKGFLATFLPSRWWRMVYYGNTNFFEDLHCLLFIHPRHIAWWAKLYRARK